MEPNVKSNSFDTLPTMITNPVISRITIYPVKSLDGISLQSAMITEGGCLLHDREYAMTDAAGNFIIGKSNPLVHKLRTNFDLEKETISLCKQGENEWKTFHLEQDRSAIESYLSDHFGMPVQWNKESTGRFLDIPDQSGVTVISSASLEEVSQWYDHMDLTETRRRFRATLEIEGVPAFWEDRLFSSEGRGVAFQIGDVNLIGMSPRARCVVPTRDPETAVVTHGFPKTFARQRAAKLPQWSTLENFGHYYYLSVDCYIPATEVGKYIKVGDRLSRLTY